ncbi:hypothetical protein NKI44_28120 [Mesorhizobium sp. M0614]|uniref:hypothetical protein n=1 Tax=unclassified Mesorhizobium TaxID=325217 RepID=UPI0003D04173|nr:hypothetical protein X734_06820 [Mesorhizobium sp. L2C084A000]
MIVLVDHDPKGHRVEARTVAFNFRDADGNAITARLRGSDCKDEEVRTAGFPRKDSHKGYRP